MDEILDNNKTGLVLSGGGNKGYSHIGVLKALEELGIKIDAISGASAGAIIGALYQNGYKIDEIKEIMGGSFFSTKNWLKNIILSFQKGVLNTKNIENIYAEYLPNSFDELKGDLFISTSNIYGFRNKNEQTIYYSKGDLYKILLATSCIPGAHEPIEYDGKLLVDGGVTDNFPIKPLIDNGYKNIIGSHVNFFDPQKKKMNPFVIASIINSNLIRNTIEESFSNCKVFIEPKELLNYKSFSLKFPNKKKIDEMVKIGYDETMKYKKDLLNLFSK